MPKPIRLGILTPSSNVNLEPITQSIIASIPNVTLHFSRFSVAKLSLEKDALSQFQTEKMVEAAILLADAGVDMIGWCGNSSGWLGFQADEDLCSAITAATGIPATTSVLALNKAVSHFSIKRMGLVTPYTSQIQTAIIDNYASIGVDCGGESHLGLTQNIVIGELGESELDGQVADVTGKDIQAIFIFCTNLTAAPRVGHWEKQHGVIIFDTIITLVWDMLLKCNLENTSLEGWGELLTTKV